MANANAAPQPRPLSATEMARANEMRTMLWAHKTELCTRRGQHDFFHCSKGHTNANWNDLRMDPVRRDDRGNHVLQPPWAYDPTRERLQVEKSFHPALYKTQPCEDHLRGRCRFEDTPLFCGYVHTRVEDQRVIDAAFPWRVLERADITWERYFKNVMTFKVNGPCPNRCTEEQRRRCVMWHTADDKRSAPTHDGLDFVPHELQDLSPRERPYDPRLYKQAACARCLNGPSCTFAHSESERNAAHGFRDRLRTFLRCSPFVPQLRTIGDKESALSDAPIFVCERCWTSTALNGVNGKRVTRPPTVNTMCGECQTLSNSIIVRQSLFQADRWIHIRQTPQIESRLLSCHSAARLKPCTNRSCTFAHSLEEIMQWSIEQDIFLNKETASVPLLNQRAHCERLWLQRPPPLIFPEIGKISTFDLCGRPNCSFGHACHKPHSEAELEEWLWLAERVSFLNECVRRGVPQSPLVTEPAIQPLEKLPSALRDVTVELDSSELSEVPHLVHLTLKGISPAAHVLGRACLISPTSAHLFRLLAARQDEVFYPVLTEGNFRGELQALAKFDASNPITLRVQFQGKTEGSYHATLVVEIDAGQFLKKDLHLDVTSTGEIRLAPAPVCTVSQAGLTASCYREQMRAFVEKEAEALDKRMVLCSLVERSAKVSFSLDEPLVFQDPQFALLSVDLGGRADDFSFVKAGTEMVFTCPLLCQGQPIVALVDCVASGVLVARFDRQQAPPLLSAFDCTISAVFRPNASLRQAALKAVDTVDLAMLFPHPEAPAVQGLSQDLQLHLVNGRLSHEQANFCRLALTAIPARVPVVLTGVTGSGRTTVAVELVQQILRTDAVKTVLYVVHSLEAGDRLLRRHLLPGAHLARTTAPQFAVSHVEAPALHGDMKPYAIWPVRPSDVASIRVIVCTAATASLLPPYLHFSTVIVDDASCIREVDLLPALSLADSAVFFGQPSPSTLQFPNALQTKLGVHNSVIPRLCSHLSSATSLQQLQHSLSSCFAAGRELLGTEPLKAITPRFLHNGAVDRQVSEAPGFVNEEEIAILIRDLREPRGAPPTRKANDQVLIVVSYAAQAAFVRAALARERLRATVVTPATLPEPGEQSFAQVYVLTVRHWRTVSDNQANGEHYEDLGLLGDVAALRTIFARVSERVTVIGDFATLSQAASNEACQLWARFFEDCRAHGHFEGTADDEAKEMMKRAFYRVAPQMPPPVAAAFRRYQLLLWTYRTVLCTQPQDHPGSAACMCAHAQTELRRDPRRVGPDGSRLAYPPWLYAKTEARNQSEIDFHPESFKTNNCTRARDCPRGPLCPFVHGQENDFTCVHDWWNKVAPLTLPLSQYKAMVTKHKRQGPCAAHPACTGINLLKCMKYHGPEEEDKCQAPVFRNDDWVPPQDAFARRYDVCFFKLQLCDKSPGHCDAPSAALCSNAHGSLDLAVARSFRQSYHTYELRQSEAVKALMGFTGKFGPEPRVHRRNYGPPALPLPSAQPSLSHPPSPSPALVASKPGPKAQASEVARILPPVTASHAISPPAPEANSVHERAINPGVPLPNPTEAPPTLPVLQAPLPFALHSLATDRSWLRSASDPKSTLQAVLQQIAGGLAVDRLLFDALVESHFEAVRVLVIYLGADVNRKYVIDNKVLSLLHILCHLGLPDPVVLLLRLGANREVVDSEGNTPLSLALQLQRDAFAKSSPNMSKFSRCFTHICEVKPVLQEESMAYFAALQQPMPAQPQTNAALFAGGLSHGPPQPAQPQYQQVGPVQQYQPPQPQPHQPQPHQPQLQPHQPHQPQQLQQLLQQLQPPQQFQPHQPQPQQLQLQPQQLQPQQLMQQQLQPQQLQPQQLMQQQLQPPPPQLQPPHQQLGVGAPPSYLPQLHGASLTLSALSRANTPYPGGLTLPPQNAGATGGFPF